MLKSLCVLKVFSRAKIESVCSFGNFAKIYEFCNSNRHSHRAAFSLRSVAVDRYNSAIFVLALGLPTEINYYIITEFLLGIIIVSFVDFLQQLQSEYASELLQTAKTIG